MAQGKKRGITGSVLKIIALVSMLIDHLAVVLIEGNYGNKDSFLYRHSWSSETILQVDAVLREMGRLAFPIFCFLLVQGAMYTHDRRKYLRNMVIFALLSEVPFDLAVYNTVWHTAHQNVFFTLALGLLAIDCLDRWQQEKPWLGFGMVVATGAVAWLLHTDYSVYGVFLIVLFWLFRYDEKLTVIYGSLWLVLGMGLSEAAGILAFIPIHFYNGERGRQMKYVFYAFYPLHLLALYGVRILLG